MFAQVIAHKNNLGILFTDLILISMLSYLKSC